MTKSNSTNLEQSNHIKLLVLIPVFFILAYLPVWKNLISVWYRSEDYSHGFFIVPIALYILWNKRAKLLSKKHKPSYLGIAVLLMSLSLYIISYYAEIKTTAYLSIIFSIFGVVLYLFGTPILKEIIFPLLLLFFMIPIPQQIYTSITLPLQLLVSKVSVWLALLVGIPIFREGNVIFLPEHTLQVVEACSGMRSLTSLLTLSLLIAYFSLNSNKLRILLFFSGIPSAIMVNITRVLIIIFAFYIFDFDTTQGTLHTILGVVIFLISILLVLLIKKVLSLWDTPTQ